MKTSSGPLEEQWVKDRGHCPRKGTGHGSGQGHVQAIGKGARKGLGEDNKRLVLRTFLGLRV